MKSADGSPSLDLEGMLPRLDHSMPKASAASEVSVKDCSVVYNPPTCPSGHDAVLGSEVDPSMLTPPSVHGLGQSLVPSCTSPNPVCSLASSSASPGMLLKPADVIRGPRLDPNHMYSVDVGSPMPPPLAENQLAWKLLLSAEARGY
ncbi:hypothetical protein Nepgr_033866 [Nepenthes gracilis]|uniref:Uncharacterized protein n=1 Tax=Nepenthes gracilis TaxID=150966 RepID=A0AAD3Y6Z0_NEPGR|nr:hypothetical protein Nepgr_033866 [Nepenthes gracilis]